MVPAAAKQSLPFTAQISPSAPAVGEAITVTPVASSDDGDAVAIEARWDDDYDGSWETAYAPLAAHTLAAVASPSVPHVKVRARNKSGRIAGSVARIDRDRFVRPGASCGGEQTRMGLELGPTAAISWRDRCLPA